MITGSIGMLPSMQASRRQLGLYEPYTFCSDMPGQDKATIATVLSIAML